ncbi:ATP-binding protein [Roseateles koreensis]|uniref:histidine kinase n=1 Tax=Roseateles koreensis TaxID=2987526 RepID=A0ABT5KSH7_9BURK|nr:ATP-binding protein [Roseateles koreensis]MDC8784732.1 ATP-binding protein [Roseateles koreensis]
MRLRRLVPEKLAHFLLADTLSKRLFLLMWGALVLSHMLAFIVVTLLLSSSLDEAWRHRGGLQAIPLLPPTPGLSDPMGDWGPAGGPAHGQEDLQGLPPMDFDPFFMAEPGGMHAPHGIPAHILAVDYGVRFIVIALAAWWGSRWLSRPMDQLTQAAHSLGRNVSHQLPPPPLDEHSGTVEVREAAHVFNSMSQQLREQFLARSLMVAAISHDLRTPLTRLRMRLETMQGDPLLTARSVADITEMNALLDSTLNLFRDEGMAALDGAEATDIGTLVQAVVDDLAEQGQPVTLSVETDHAIARVQAQALRRVLDNLISNALRYGELAHLHISQDATAIHICVDDDGPGIAAADLGRVFQPFYRVEASRNRNTGGVGLGLYIARDLTLRQGGELTLSNRSPRGLRAHLKLPKP